MFTCLLCLLLSRSVMRQMEIFCMEDGGRLKSSAKMLLLVLLVGLLSFECSAAEYPRLPEEFPLCSVSDPKYEVCLKEASQVAFSLLNKGIPSLGLATLDPLLISKIQIDQGAGAVRISLQLLNSTLSGMKNVKVISQSNDLPRGGCDMRGEVQLEEFSMVSYYRINGKVMLLPVKGQGISNVTMKDVNVKATMKCEKFEIDGEEFLNITKLLLKIEPTKASIYLGNLFGGDEALGNAMNALINANSKDIINDLSPALEGVFGDLFRNITNKIFHQVPYKTIFLP